MAPNVEQADPGGVTGNTTPQQSSMDIEKISSLNLNVAEEETARFERPISGWAWALVCVGLSLGSLLYGKVFKQSMFPKLIMKSQDWILQLLPMCKGPFSNP
jgi:hypothetical protein